MKKEWRDQHNYEFPDDYSLHRWAWEFLRRNSGYIADWDSALIPLVKERPGVINRIKGTKFYIHSTECFNEWGLSPGYINPDQDWPKEIAIHQKQWSGISYGDVIIPHQPFLDFRLLKNDTNGVFGMRLTKDQIAVVFDLSLPLKPQWEKVKPDLKKIQRGLVAPRRHINKWGTYLQVFDAKLAGARNGEISQ